MISRKNGRGCRAALWESYLTGRRFGALLVALMVVGSASARAQSDWITYTPQDKGFTLELPATPQESSNSGTESGVAFDSNSYVASIPGFAVVINDTVYRSAADPRPEMARDSFVSGLQGRLIASRDHPYERGPGDVVSGIEYTVQSSRFACRGYAHVDGLRMIGLVACGVDGADHTSDIERVLASYKISRR